MLKAEREVDQNTSNTNILLMEKARKELGDTLRMEEIFWRQKANIKRAMGGERNTKFYHFVSKSKAVRNKVVGIYYETGQWIEEEKEIAENVV